MFLVCMGMSNLICAFDAHGVEEGIFIYKHIYEALKMKMKHSHPIQGISSFSGTTNEPLDLKS